MVAHHEAAIAMFQAVGSGCLRNEPITGRIVVAQLERRRLRVQANQTAIAAFDDLENFVGGAIQAVGCGKQHARIGG